MPDRGSRPTEPPDECANCGASIPRRARACPECGADERSGWRETDPYDALDLPAEAFGEDRTQGRRGPRRFNGVAWYWWAVGVALLGFLLAKWVLGAR